MAYDASIALAQTAAAPRAHFLRGERLVVLLGAMCVGAVAGFAFTMSVGRLEFWMLALAASPVLAFAAHLAIQTMRDAFGARAWGCVAACVLHVAALVVWPIAASMAASVLFWIAPVMALSALILFASCWDGGARAVYRASAQGGLVAAIAAQQGVTVLLG